MKYLVLFLLALVIPVSAAHAVKSPYVSNNIDNVERALNQKNPFSSSKARQFRKQFKQQKKLGKANQYNGDESGGSKIKSGDQKSKGAHKRQARGKTKGAAGNE